MNRDIPRFTCRDLAMKVSEYIDDELQAPERRLFDEHKDQCPGCRGMVASLRWTIEGIRQLSHDAGHPRVMDLLEETMQRVRKQGS